jgi:hypothetical protein
MKSADQVWGAERWLREHPDRVFLDRACTQSLPLEIPPAGRMRVHRLVVAHNIAEHRASYFGGGSSGTLVFNSNLTGKDHYSDPAACTPFEIGWLDGDRGFVHVLDESFLDTLLSARDTVTDFVKYLRFHKAPRRVLRVHVLHQLTHRVSPNRLRTATVGLIRTLTNHCLITNRASNLQKASRDSNSRSTTL